MIQSPLPVFSTLAQGESFSILDLARAYKQMEVAAESQLYLTINTHMGLFCYQRLPFGIYSHSPCYLAEGNVNCAAGV